MTEEDYKQYIEDAFYTDFRYMEVNSSAYNKRQGELFEEIKVDSRVSQRQALGVVALLNRGEVEASFEMLEEALEDGS